MAKRKSEQDYAADIVDLHVQLLDYPDSESIKKKIEYRVKKWMSFLTIHIEVANNEQREWTAEMLGYPTCPMPTKKDSGARQVADYVGVLTTCNGDKYIDTIVERKSLADLYSTLIVDSNRERLYREIDRFKADERFDKMVIIVEGSYTDFMLYAPEFTAGKFDYKKRFNSKKNDSINEKKLTVLADLFVNGVPVMFCDTPTMAAQFCGRLFKESVRKNYAKILEIDKVMNN